MSEERQSTTSGPVRKFTITIRSSKSDFIAAASHFHHLSKRRRCRQPGLRRVDAVPLPILQHLAHDAGTDGAGGFRIGIDKATVRKDVHDARHTACFLRASMADGKNVDESIERDGSRERSGSAYFWPRNDAICSRSILLVWTCIR